MKDLGSEPAMPIITLLTDFGIKDPYVAEMKAAIVSICTEAQIIDISHQIEKFNVHMGAFMLASATPYFPEKTVHVAVVDPTIGTKRRPIIVETRRFFYVGPDNGVLMLSARKEGIRRVCQITNVSLMASKVSKTFHGRDIFAPVAAYLVKGKPLPEFGPEISDYIIPRFADPKIGRDELLGEILYIDDFGNVICNVSAKDLEKIRANEEDSLNIELKGKMFRLRFCSTYGDVPVKQSLAIIGSHDFLEISVNQGNAAEKFRASIGDSFRLLRL